MCDGVCIQFLGRLGSGVSSTGITLSVGHFLQFPRSGLRAADPWTRSNTVLSQLLNCWIVIASFGELVSKERLKRILIERL